MSYNYKPNKIGHAMTKQSTVDFMMRTLWLASIDKAKRMP